MLNILTTFTYQDGSAFPGTLARDSSGALSTDGTEFIAAMVNDYMFGIMQALLAYTGQTPNGTVEGPSNSQYLEAHRRAFGTPGEVVAAAINGDPATLGLRLIKLIGQGIVRANYPLLDAIVYVGDANNAAVAAASGKFYRADNANGTSPNVAGAYLILPDMRGLVIRGLDTPHAVDPDGATRKLGHKQLDSFQGHRHKAAVLDTPKNWVSSLGEGSSVAGNSVSITGATTKEVHTDSPNIVDGSNGTPRPSTETRMVNCALDFYIRY
jgi:hypothetical protein